MEKLFLLLSFLCLTTTTFKAQEYAVFKINGAPLLKEGGISQSLKNGYLIKSGVITVQRQDTLVLLDTSGNLFELNSPGKIDFGAIKQYPKTSNTESFSKKYLSYVWRKISKKEQTSNHTGNVYREGVLDMLKFPRDSVMISTNTVAFTWQANSQFEYSYFFLKNHTSQTLSKIRVKGNEITLYADNTFLKKGQEYSWGIAYDKFPDFDKIKFNTFYYLKEDVYKEKLESLDSVIKDLTDQEFSKKEINDALCRYHNLCTESM